MTSASDRTDDRIIVPPGEDDQFADGRVIHASIVSDDEPDVAGSDEANADEAGEAADGRTADGLPQRTPMAGESPGRPMSSDQLSGDQLSGDQLSGDQLSGDQPRRAWIPETLAPGQHRLGQPTTAQSVPAQSVPAQRPPFESDLTHEPETADEPDQADEPDEAYEPTAAYEPVSATPEPGEDEPDEPDELDELDEPGIEASEASQASQPEVPEPSQPVTVPPTVSPAASGSPETGESAAENPWPEIQSLFVDDPRRAVERASQVTSTALADLITVAKEVERTLGSDWRPDRTGTEELRVALRGYRDLGARIATLTREFQRR